ncbi:hypothetical protein [Vibrio hangzhouensis]|uniref:Uncharacterized protein n=1 Tax=Vibrio hangzhouensis TaxID=462991 RepID=A0A1H5U8H7_9VIBR|nr:hypothetical protein [Vibrio hangzhouensis]MBY6197097.1 hypothetical protein [Vibrio hangzhouensis]SEF71334.1 hypothetical protein SAMN04488244_10359 [Vibrio hangzhouensis]
MDIKHVVKGMWVESQHGAGKVLVVDEVSQSVLVEPLGSDEQWALSVDEVEEELQLHNGCDQYY